MGLLVEGEWREDARDGNRGGAYLRPESRFRRWIGREAEFPAAAGRYHLYVANACPWCHRTVIFRSLKGLENVLSLSTVEPLMLEGGWRFAEPDPLTGARYVHEIYQRADPRYTGRASVPVLWDKERGTIVNNESSDIVRMLNAAFAGFASNATDYYPADLVAEIDAINARLYETVNNGVYRAGFATAQGAYEAAARALFETLDWIEARLGERRYLAGDRITEADWRLFPTLVRFDAVYYGHFKCNLRHVYEYSRLWAYTRELYQVPGIARTVTLDEYKLHYYGSHRRINPTGIVPLGPVLDFAAPHGRG